MPKTPFFTWSENLSVGVAVLDDDHKQLLGIMSSLHEGLLTVDAREVLEGGLDLLLHSTQTHFAREEQMLTAAGCRVSLEHMKAHNELTRQMMDLRLRYKNGACASLSIEILHFLRDWLMEHIQTADKLYQTLLEVKGIH